MTNQGQIYPQKQKASRSLTDACKILLLRIRLFLFPATLLWVRCYRKVIPFNRISLMCMRFHIRTIINKSKFQLLNTHRGKTVVTLNQIAVAVTYYLIEDQIFESVSELVTREREIFESEAKRLREDPEIRKLLSNYFRARAFHYSHGWKFDAFKERAEEGIKKAQEYDADATPLSKEDLKKLNRSIRATYKTLKREYGTQLRRYLSDITTNILPKIEVRASHFIFIMSTSGTIFLLSGYIYSKFFLRAFGVNVSDFFTVNDYLSVSIDKIYFACISAVIGSAVYLWGMYSGLRGAVISFHFEVEPRRSDYQMLFMVSMWSLLTVLAFYRDLPGKFGLLSTLIFFAATGIYQRLNIERYVKNATYVSVFIVAFIYFAVHIFYDISNDIDTILRSSPTEPPKYRFVFASSDLSLDGNSVRLLARTSDFFILYDKLRDKVYVVPKSDVRMVSIDSHNLGIGIAGEVLRVFGFGPW